LPYVDVHPTLVDSSIFLIGLAVLYFGADWLIRGATSFALRFGIRPLVVGLTVVALGTSMPEFLVNFFAAVMDQDGLALGNVVGSNICNIALILGVSSIVYPMAVAPDTLRKEYPIMMAAMAVFYLVSLDGTISRFDGMILVTGLVGFLIFLVLDARRHGNRVDLDDLGEMTKREVQMPTLRKVAYLLGGMVMLTLGARLMVHGAVHIATDMGVDPIIVGLTVVAIGTSLPELAASVMCAVKKEADLSVGNILGSNLLNVLFVVGLVALIRPLRVDESSLTIHFPVMMFFGFLLLPLAWTKYRITRLEGGILILGFFGYIAYLVGPYT
jgi:cation:H+ antiporter